MLGVVRMTSNELRTSYLKFFESKGHLIHPSDSLVPNDPSLLYTSAGMVQFKPYFIGERVPPCRRITTSQKCLRTDDIDEVGDGVHHTFFEMLGNFSFGDYFKLEAITWAWEYLTEVLKLNPDHLWTSVYLDDDEAAEIWEREIGFPSDRIVRLGEDKNYWPANAPSQGPNGPCGPCNEIFLDVAPHLGRPEDPTWAIAHDGNRFVEIWNLVFTQFDRQEDGTMKPLPSKNIDTGMGLERTIAVLQSAPSDYETDLFLPIVKRVEKLSGARYGAGDEPTDRSIRVISDHIRGAVFAIADGVMPSNLGRGHVLRRLIRRAVLQGSNLGLDKPFMHELVGIVVDLMKDAYPEPKERQDYVTSLIKAEEEKFRRTLDAGMERLREQIDEVKRSRGSVLSGEAAFVLHDTYGFPLELTQEIAAAEGLGVDVEGFNTAMEEQRRRAKDSSQMGASLFVGEANAISELEQTLSPTVFVGYDELEAESVVVAMLSRGEQVNSAREGESVEIILDVTPFYAESGGQVGDHGQIFSKGAVVKVNDTIKVSNFFVHSAEIVGGELRVGERVRCQVDDPRRMAIARNHTATHLLHASLRNILGSHALQSGSVVEPSRLRFDFSHFQAVTAEELRRIEDEVNEKVLADLQGLAAGTSTSGVVQVHSSTIRQSSMHQMEASGSPAVPLGTDPKLFPGTTATGAPSSGSLAAAPQRRKWLAAGGCAAALVIVVCLAASAAVIAAQLWGGSGSSQAAALALVETQTVVAQTRNALSTVVGAATQTAGMLQVLPTFTSTPTPLPPTFTPPPTNTAPWNFLRASLMKCTSTPSPLPTLAKSKTMTWVTPAF